VVDGEVFDEEKSEKQAHYYRGVSLHC